jgi:hypothetical protein
MSFLFFFSFSFSLLFSPEYVARVNVLLDKFLKMERNFDLCIDGDFSATSR